jgi:hypothetical protein
VRRSECERREERHCKDTRHARDLDDALEVVFAFVGSTTFGGGNKAELECPFAKGTGVSQQYSKSIVPGNTTRKGIGNKTEARETNNKVCRHKTCRSQKFCFRIVQGKSQDVARCQSVQEHGLRYAEQNTKSHLVL